MLLNNEGIALGMYVISVVLVTQYAVHYGSLQQRFVWAIVFLAVMCGFMGVVSPRYQLDGTYGCAIATVLVGAWALLDRRGGSKRWLARASDQPIVLRPPFAGRWRVAAGGPDRRFNHHQVVSDQYFAYDFLRCEGPSWDQPILAPCAGMIAHVENRQDDAPPSERRRNRARPFGNYVSIETPRGYVILAHLRRDSVCVRVGDTVTTGTELGRCGNSGNTRGAHLHVHAQDAPTQNVGIARGVPIAFADSGTGPMLLEYGDTLDGNETMAGIGRSDSC
jgi:hypothetical protein